ncbi:MAG: phosphate ABC transporter permease PstA [Bacteroidota bacterium]|nr:phosphate ABC transporter permease PstA [Bacteroidota bacterium]MDP4229106.1 phosphate ABC transporter permease PstA [Bacteroidota bacterium]MDP4235021.1 phosphate ABC transporter permease PstA [Bacteroidota bacterium]
MTNAALKWRITKNKLFVLSLFLFAGLTAVPLVLILYYIISNGISAINWDFLTQLPKPVGESGGGILNAIVGTIMLIVNATLFAAPVGVLAGVYLSEYPNTQLAKIAGLFVEILQGIPSIVIGIVAYVWLVSPIGNFSALSGSAALAIMMLPVIVRTTEETIKLVPNSMKEASLALGISTSRTILRVIIPNSLSGIITGVTLAVARIAGETAPLLFTAFGNPFLSFNALQPVHSLPLLIYNYATSPYDDWHRQGWGASLILIVMILILSIISKLLIKRWKVQF